MTENRLFFDPKAQGRPMRVAAFMSGSGSNVVELLKHQADLYEIAFIFCDRSDGKSRGEAIALKAGIPYFSHDIRRFHQTRGLKRSVMSEEGMAARREFDRVAARLVAAFEIDVIALGGYMSFLTLSGAVNVHPADLTIVDDQGRRRFVGDDAVLDAIAAGQTELRSSTLWTDLGVDSGPLLMVSEALPVELPAPLEELLADPARLRQAADANQERLKQAGDWVIFPQTLKLMAAGRMGLTADGVVTLDGAPRPLGIRPSETGL